MVVANIVNAVSGEIIENTPAVRREKLGSKASVILHVHLQNVKECRPTRIDVSCVV
jgi:hypothetical protein